MKGKSSTCKASGRDYAMMAAIIAILASVAVAFGIAYRYSGRLSQPRISQRA
jgi:hypothetical protein